MPRTTQVKKSSPMSFESKSAVTIRVGKIPSTKDFIAHEGFLTSRSEFFRRAMNGNWKEAETRIINFPEDKAETSELKKLTKKEFGSHVNDRYRTIFSVFMLSEKLQDITTKNAMMVVALATTKLKGIENLWLSPDHHTVNTIYNGTPPGSPARRFVIDWWTAISIDSIFPHVQYFHKEFLKDLDKSIAKHCPISLGHIPLKNGIAAYQDKPTED